ncbi:stage III sporulation protein AE [Mediterraneibacter glycyrrhizinilyticus]|uniref:stage III sporulation protein AE n=1 Tax=Mediterraneibacter glycyrrhizinilyticus TaxID=342942 RepID=UPI00195FC819|nr:stage III sporulation protein AE [Mediterraneibacter glycyrrhizinilyticus]MBM6803403.1 stage III sporulation protein AE [Mediterraneibacter glycyrrhizinilyticus]MDM8211572.1 stage III sporulation protein AE [Mediterraneibacter glycyrrhizinilyticus]
MSGKKGRFLFTILLVLIVFGLGTKIVNAKEDPETDILQDEIQDALLAEFDFNEIEENLDRMFPQEKISFSDVFSALMSGNMAETIRIFLRFLTDQISYEFDYNRRSLVYVLMTALTAAVFSNFAGAFKSRQISDISFYIMYMLLITLCLTSFRISAEGLEDRLSALVDFMRVLCPSYFLAVAFASGSVTSLFFYNVILFLIYVVELVIVRFLLPVVNIYIMVRVLGNLTGEDFLSEFADLIRKAVSWILKTLLICVVSVNVVQGLLAPAIDAVKRSALTRTAEALPWVGNAVGGVAEVVLGTAVLIKNGIGMAGAVITIAICAVPIFQMLIMAFMYKLAAALVQPVSDKRITTCISGISEGYEIMVKVIFTSGLLFMITIAIVAASTS